MHDACAARWPWSPSPALCVAAVFFAVMREEAPASGPTVDEKIAILRDRARQPAGPRRQRGTDRPAACLPYRQPAARCPAGAFGIRRRSRLRSPAGLPAPGFRRARRAEWRPQGRAGHGRARARGLPPTRPQPVRRHSSTGCAGRRCAADPVLYAALRAAAPRHRRTDAGAQCSECRAWARAAGRAAARHAGRTGGQPGGAGRAALRAGLRRRPATTIRRCRSRSSGRIWPLPAGRRRCCRSVRGAGRRRCRPSGCAFRCRARPSSTDARRTSFAAAALSIRRGSRTVLFQLLFTVLPDRPGSFAFDQRVRTTTLESNTLVSPEILSRAPAGRDPHGPPLLRSAGRLALRQGASARGHRRAAGLAG